MKIAAHISGKKIFNSFLFNFLIIIARNYPYQQIVLFVEDIVGNVPSNLKQIKIDANNKATFAYWKKFKLPKLIKTEEIGCYVSETGFLNPNIVIPQYLFFSDNNFDSKKRSFISSLSLAKYIFVTENFIGDSLNKKEKIKVVYHGLPQKSRTFNNTELNCVKEENTNGHDYILFPVDNTSAKSILIVLKAFSLLKKWQKTSMKLMLLLDNIVEDNLIADFKNYKYKSDVVFVNASEENSGSLTAASFITLFFSEYEKINKAFIAMQNNVPIVVTNTAINKSLFYEAALYVSLNETAIFETMQVLYKDESKRNQIRHKATTLLQKYNPEKAATDLFKLITE